MRKAAMPLLLLIAVYAVAFAAEQPLPPGQDIYGPWEWAHSYHTLTQNNPYTPPSPSPWSKAWTVVSDCSDNSVSPMQGGGFATRFFSNTTEDGVVHQCDNWFDVESLTTLICPPTSMCDNQWWQYELYYANSDPDHSIGGPVLYPQDNTPVVIPPFQIMVGDVWYTKQVPHWHEGLADEAPLFIQDSSFWVVVKPVGPDYPGTNVFMWHDPTGPWYTPPQNHIDGRFVYDAPNPDAFVFGEDLPGGYNINARHGVPIMAALISKHAYIPTITSPRPAGRIPQGVPVNVMANMLCRTSPSYVGRWEDQDYGPVRFWITTLNGSQIVYDQTIDPFLFPNPPFTANPLPASFPQWDVNVPPGDYWMYCYNAFPHDWYTTNPALKQDKKLITVYAQDVAVSSIDQPTGTYNEGTWITPRARVLNLGSIPATFDVRFWVPNTAYDGTRQITELAPGAELEVKFEELAASYAGRYEGHCRVFYQGDMNPTNDELVNPFEVLVTSNPAGKASPTPGSQNIATSKTFTPRGEVALLANPVSRVARISVPGSVPISVDIYRSDGRLVGSFNTNEFDISNLANGIYLMRVAAYSDTKMLRLVVEH